MNMASHDRPVSRIGITPIVSIILLLMMSITAVGATYDWFSNMQEDIQNDAGTDLRTDVSVTDADCRYNPSSDDQIVLAIKNVGSKNIAGSHVDVFVYDQKTRLNMTFSQMDWQNNPNTYCGDAKCDFLEANGFDTVTLNTSDADASLSQTLADSAFYTVEVDFTVPGITVEDQCLAG